MLVTFDILLTTVSSENFWNLQEVVGGKKYRSSPVSTLQKLCYAAGKEYYTYQASDSRQITGWDSVPGNSFFAS